MFPLQGGDTFGIVFTHNIPTLSKKNIHRKYRTEPKSHDILGLKRQNRPGNVKIKQGL